MTSRPHISLDRTLLFFVVLLFSLPIIAAEQLAFPDDYFHGGAMRYLSNNIPAALDIVTNGRLKFPDDEKLRKLEELLKQQQQNQQNDQQKSEDQKQQEQKKDDSKQSKKDEQKKDQENKDQQKSDEEQEKEKEKQNQQKKQQQSKPDDKKNSEEPQPSAASQKNEQMTPEQAMRVLDTTKGDEKVLPIQMEKPPQTDKKFKDW